MNEGATDEMPAQVSLQTKLKIFWDQLPLLTKSTFAICASIYAATLIIGWDNLGTVCISADSIISTSPPQIWRFITSALFHSGILHLTFNMMAFIPMGALLERKLGSFTLFLLILILIFAGDVLYIAASYLAYIVGYSNLLTHCAVGFSGVIFGLIPVEVKLGQGVQRSIFGLFVVPAFYYPWILLVLWQLLVPQSSFLGHLSGLAIGQLYVMGRIDWMFPSAAIIQNIERKFPFAGHSSYITVTGGEGSEPLLLPVYHGGDHHTGGNNTALTNLLGRFFPQRANAEGSSSSNTITTSSSREAQPVGGKPAVLDPKAAAAAAAQSRASSSSATSQLQQQGDT